MWILLPTTCAFTLWRTTCAFTLCCLKTMFTGAQKSRFWDRWNDFLNNRAIAAYLFMEYFLCLWCIVIFNHYLTQTAHFHFPKVWVNCSTPYNRIEHSTGYTISAIDKERGYYELSVLYMERRFNIYPIIWRYLQLFEDTYCIFKYLKISLIHMSLSSNN